MTFDGPPKPPPPRPPPRTPRTGSAHIGQLSENGPIGWYPQFGQVLDMAILLIGRRQPLRYSVQVSGTAGCKSRLLLARSYEGTIHIRAETTRDNGEPNARTLLGP